MVQEVRLQRRPAGLQRGRVPRFRIHGPVGEILKFHGRATGPTVWCPCSWPAPFAPASGALGWIDTFALPAKGKSDEAAYAWINFVMQPEVAAMITESSSYFTASQGADEFVNEAQKAQFQASFPQEAIDNIKWYPPVPAGLEAIEGGVLDRVKAAN